jgi:hypothetical protein
VIRKNNLRMMYIPLVAEYCKNLTEHKYTLCGERAEFLVFNMLVPCVHQPLVFKKLCRKMLRMWDKVV